MPSVRLHVTLPELNREAYLRDFRQAIRQVIILAAQKFLQEAIPRIPVWTGMASGALENMEVFAGVTIPRQPPATRRTGYYYYGQRRTPELGQSLATQPNQILTGDLTSAETGTRLHFQFNVNIDYFDQLDEQVWGAFAAGEDAFYQELNDQLSEIAPFIGDYFITRRVL